MSIVGERFLLDLAVPAHNEEEYLVGCIERLNALPLMSGGRTRITIVDSASTDSTWMIACYLAARHPNVSAIRVDKPGRGRALRAAWVESTAPYLAYTDADLSANPAALASMLELLEVNTADIVIASRLVPGARVTRSTRREVLSRGYAEVLQWVAEPPFRDVQCGMKVMRGDLVRDMLPNIAEEHWFFDTELLLKAWTRGHRVVEVPIEWIERRDSRVRLLSTIAEDLLGITRLTSQRLKGPRRWSMTSSMLQHLSRSAVEISLGLALGTAAKVSSPKSPAVVAVVAGAIASAAVVGIRPSKTPTLGSLTITGISLAEVLGRRWPTILCTAAAFAQVLTIEAWSPRSGGIDRPGETDPQPLEG